MTLRAEVGCRDVLGDGVVRSMTVTDRRCCMGVMTGAFPVSLRDEERLGDGGGGVVFFVDDEVFRVEVSFGGSGVRILHGGEEEGGGADSGTGLRR